MVNADSQTLYHQLLDLEGRSYPAYKSLKGSYSFPNFTLIIDRIQGDPFAKPSQFRVKIPQTIAKFPASLYASPSRTVALEDYLLRQFQTACQRRSDSRGMGKSGLICCLSPGQEILKRSALRVCDREIEARFVVGLPARGRTILGRQAADIIGDMIPQIVKASLIYAQLDSSAIQNHVETAEDADFIRDQLSKRELIAFVANGSILPRRSGIDARPAGEAVIPFQSPPSLEIDFNCPNQGRIRGMGIPQGITLIVGGGYHGKSTLLNAIALGVYNHIPGDGREYVITDANTVKIRAEDGRSIVDVNISPFINHLPQGRSTEQFTTSNASGSTSQAANIIEAITIGAKVLLLDEDTSATNFMIRDRRMQQLIAKDKEPITPFIDKVRQLYQDYGVSTLLVMGGSGDYFEVADRVIALENFLAYDRSEAAKAITGDYPSHRHREGTARFGNLCDRIPLVGSVPSAQRDHRLKQKIRDSDEITLGGEAIDLAAVEQIVEAGQLRAIADALIYAQNRYLPQHLPLSILCDRILTDIEQLGLDSLNNFPEGDRVYFRRFELAAACNRLRSLQVHGSLAI